MTEANAGEFAEFGAAALDAFQGLFEETEHLDHRGNDAHAHELLGDLLIDLKHYAEQCGLEFNDILAQAHGYYLSEQNSPDVFAIGSSVQLDGPAAAEAILLGQPTRGSITGLLVPEHGPTEYYVHFLGSTTYRSIIAADLEPAPPFPDTPTAEGVIDSPLRAEEILIETITRIGIADVRGVSPQPDDFKDHHALLNALAAWNGMDERSVTDWLLPHIAPRLPSAAQDQPEIVASSHPLSPGQLAAQAFPVPLARGISYQEPYEQGAQSNRPADTLTHRSSCGH
ncbi:hypothetical protein [Actinomadura macra]|uniref:hypothetical protein n=1 Tax=Actinomadura macra TaxID=46164 RepID=UPI000831023F|nr:hypothetical protein [Actinomadura macra]